MKTTMTLAANARCSPFDVFNQDTDEVIMMINFYIYLGEDETPIQPQSQPIKTAKRQEERIRVNDKTATGGWF